MSLPLVDTLTNSYEKWTIRHPTREEAESIFQKTGSTILAMQHINDKLVAKISTPFEAAEHIAKEGWDNGLSSFINLALDGSPIYALWRRKMPSQTPPVLSDYQSKYPTCDLNGVSKKINEIGTTLSSGQYLFHGGVWPDKKNFTTTRPLSATFCPQVALRNAVHKWKAYDDGKIDLFVLRVKDPKTKVFVYRRKGTRFGHENEVLFSGGAKLSLRSRHHIRDNYFIRSLDNTGKKVPVYVLNIDIS